MKARRFPQSETFQVVAYALALDAVKKASAVAPITVRFISFLQCLVLFSIGFHDYFISIYNAKLTHIYMKKSACIMKALLRKSAERKKYRIL